MLEKIPKSVKNAIMKVAWPVITNLSHWLDSKEVEEDLCQEDWFYLVNNIRLGDVLLSTKTNNPSNMFFPGKAKHAAMVVNADPKAPMLIEAVSKGVVHCPLFDFMKNKKYLVHCRSKVFGQEIRKKAVSVAEGMIGTPYDHFWSPSNNWIYCSELVYESYKKAYFNVLSDHKPASFPLEMKVRCGELTYIPDDIRLDPVHWDVLWSNTK